MAVQRAVLAVSRATTWGALAESERTRAVAMRELARCHAALRRNGSTLAKPYTLHVAGVRAWLGGDPARAFEAIERGLVEYDRLGMRLHAASLRLALAARGHRDAAALDRTARGVFQAEGIAVPERWAFMVAAGLYPYDVARRAAAGEAVAGPHHSATSEHSRGFAI
jgi:hypothetical protein